MWGSSVLSRVSKNSRLGGFGLRGAKREGWQGMGIARKVILLLLNYFLRSNYVLAKKEPEATDRTVDARLDGTGDDGHDGE